MCRLFAGLLLLSLPAWADVVCTGTANSCGASAVGTVTASGTLTANTVPKGTGAAAIANSTITDDGTTVTINTANAFKATSPQNGAVGQFNMTSTLTPNATGNPTMARFVCTGAGSSTGTPQCMVLFMGAGYTGATQSILAYMENDTAGTNATFLAGNSLIQGSVVGATTGVNNGIVLIVNSSTVSNVPFTGLANGNSAGANTAVVGLATNGGAGTKTGVYGALKATIPTYVTAAAQFDNAAIAAPILVLQDAGTNVFIIGDGGDVQLNRTITAGGTTGAQTINKTSGTVNFAAAATTLVVTNSLVTTSSIVYAVVRTNDSTATIKNVVPAAGSFTITLTAAATAETSVGFFVTN